MLMIKLLNPKYYMPVKGEYRYMVNNANIANALGIPAENIFLKQNGDVVEIVDGVAKNTTEHIKVKDVLIDGKSSDDIGDLVIKDRELLSDNGIVLISATLSKKDKVLLVGPEITTKGFIYVRDSKDLIVGMRNISEEIITRNIVNGVVAVSYTHLKGRLQIRNYLDEQEERKYISEVMVESITFLSSSKAE